MRFRSLSQSVLLLVVLSLLANTIPAQSTTTGRLTGTVTDTQGALVGGAQITAKHNQTQAEFKTKANDDGGWTIPSVPNGTYTVTITAQGFKSTVIQNVAVETSTTATANASLEVGGTSEQVVVTSGGSVIQSESANVSSTITGRQISELPWATRDAMQLVLTLPGIQTPGVPRASSVNGLPKSSLNITLDGANIQDNLLKSSDGFFTSTQAKSDAVEEVTVSTATPGAESSGEGAVQIKFVTKSGSNNYRGALFWQHRNTALNSNYFFNNINGLPRDHLILNQYGGNVGGPIWIPKVFKGKDKAFFFVNMEEFRLPQTYDSPTRTVLTDSARAGIYTYKDSTGVIRNVNLYQIAAAGAGGRTYTNTPDPTIANLLGLVNTAAQKGVLKSRVDTQSDYNRLDLNFQDPGQNLRRFPTVRLDFNLTKNHHLEFIHNYQHYFSNPDGVNGQLNVYPGTGIVVGSPGITGSIYRNSFTFAMAERWTISNTLVNEVRATSAGNGATVFTREFSPGLYGALKGFVFGQSAGYTSNFHSRSSQSRRHTPVNSINDNLSYIKGTHAMNFGMAFTQVKMFQQSVATQVVPSVTFGIAATDPINTGATSIFGTTGVINFPNSTAAQRTEAAALYALLTGRISSTGRAVSLDENDHNFGAVPFTERNHQNEWGIFGQDSWKVKPNLTLNYGLRWEFQASPVNDNLVYTRTSFEGLFGVSGVGNLFKPGVFSNPIVPQYSLLNEGEKAYGNDYTNFAPTFGFAWSPEFKSGLLNKVFGDAGKTVIRGGYSIAYAREGFNAFVSIFSANNGPTVALGTDPGNFPTEFGPAGSKLLRDGNIPFLATPATKFPFTARQGDSLNDFNPDLKVGYIQSYTFGIQRELDRNTALEIRYVGNHSLRLWRQYELNDVNIFENGFLNEFKNAQNNLAISRLNNKGNNYGNQGLAGQVAVPIIQTAIGSATDSTTITSLDRGEAGRVANAIAGNLTRMNNLMNNGLVPFVTLPDPNGGPAIRLSNFFIVNPRSPGGAFLMDNGAGGTYNSLQVELRRRLSNGILVQGSYVWSKSMTNTFATSSAAFSQPTTLRDLEYDKGPAPRDMRHAFKVDWIHEFPIGPGHKLLGDHIPVISKLVEGWQWGGVARIQSGTPILLTGGRQTYNQRESGVVLHNINAKQLQDMMKIRKTTVCTAGKCQGVVYFLPQALIDNTLAAFEVGGKTLANLNPALPYIGPPTTAGQLGNRIFLYGPWQARFDLNLTKRTRITERTDFEFRVQFLNAFNRPNFTIQAASADVGTAAVNSATFGQTTNAYRDFTVSGTNDPGGRLIEFQLRLNFR